MKIFTKYILVVVAAFQFGVANANELVKLTKSNYKTYGKDKSVIILQINWGRFWKCGGYDNAQLQYLNFTKLQPKGKADKPVVLKFNNPSKLTAKNIYLPYAYIIKPGEYAVTAFDVKVARSGSNIDHLKSTKEKLLKNGNPRGGTFRVVANEAVYIGSFGLDCKKQPILWRYYIDGRNEFDRFVKGFRWKYSFIKKMPVTYRLFSTRTFGKSYSLGE